mmetsp:Transcript_47984/g.104421  ORF Transcript_47984/g.104421 Transcript_47984/m.104421 type:complete len:570 (+) Transcript_47984:59-1768(+)
MAPDPGEAMAPTQVLSLLGSGCDGVDEMQALLDDRSVLWAILRFELGSGSFRRQKMVFMHINGEECPAMKRGRANAFTSQAQRLLAGGEDSEGFHASVEVTQKDEVTSEKLMERIRSFFVEDDLGDIMVQWRSEGKFQRHGKVSRSMSLPAYVEPVKEKPPRCMPGHQSSELFSTGRDALRAVADPFGLWNWVLLGADAVALPMVGGGTGSVDELRAFASDREDQVFFGLLRLGFGVARLRRTRHIFLHICGKRVSVVKRGQLGALRAQMEKAVQNFAHCPVSLVDVSPEELQLEAVIDRVRRAVVVDDQVLEGDNNRRQALTVDAFREALAEDISKAEAKARSLEEESKPATKPGSSLSVEDTVRLVRTPDGPLNWALFGPHESLVCSKRAAGGTQPKYPRSVSGPVGGYAGAQNRASHEEKICSRSRSHSGSQWNVSEGKLPTWSRSETEDTTFSRSRSFSASRSPTRETSPEWKIPEVADAEQDLPLGPQVTDKPMCRAVSEGVVEMTSRWQQLWMLFRPRKVGFALARLVEFGNPEQGQKSSGCLFREFGRRGALPAFGVVPSYS